MSEGRDWATVASLGIVGAAAAITSFAAQADLAKLAGWPEWMAWLLPATDDVYGIAATRIWLSANSGPELKKHARAHAAGALLLSMAGNAMDHAVNKGALHLGSHLWLLVVAVSLVPPIALGALMHLVTLRGRDQATVDGTADATRPLPNRAIAPRTVPPTKPLAAGSVETNRAIRSPQPSHRTVPSVPATVPSTVPAVPATKPSTEPVPSGTVPGGQANQANAESGLGSTLPPEVRPGVTPPEYVLDAARKICAGALDDGREIKDRKLAALTREHFNAPHPVIGRSACASIIADAERAEETG